MLAATTMSAAHRRNVETEGEPDVDAMTVSALWPTI